MSISRKIAAKAGAALAGVRAGEEKLAATRFDAGLPRLTLRSDAFEHGGPLPKSATAEGEGVPPALSWSEPPAATQELVLLCEDPDAPKPEPFVHWLVYDINPRARGIDAEGATHARHGRNTLMQSEFTPAAPPPGHGTHHYHFQLFALDAPLALDIGEGKSKVLDAMAGHVIAFGEIVGTYART